MSKTICIYHGNCADGFGAAYAMWHRYGKGVEYFPGVYQNEPPDVTGRIVYMLDFSYKRAVVEKMAEKAEAVMIIDHHKTAIDDLAPLVDAKVIDAVFDTEHSGAVLAWDYFRKGLMMPRLLNHIEDRDLWRFALDGTREIQANVFSYPYDFEVWHKLMTMNTADLREAGAAIERKHHKDIAELVQAFRHRRVIGGHNVPVANLPYTLTSDAGHFMAQDEPFAACYWDTKEGRVYSLRSTDTGLDVSEIAKQYGGGGHRNASGFRVPYSHELAGPPA